MNFYQGVVENRNDPLKLGRCQVRVFGLHTHDKTQLPVADLPWAYPMQSITSAAMSGIGSAPVGPVEGTWVVVMFTDDDNQYPIMMGTLGGIAQPDLDVDQDPPGILLKDEDGNTPSAPTETVTSDKSSEPVQTTTPPAELTPQQQAQNTLQPGTNKVATGATGASGASGATGASGASGASGATVTTDIPTDPPPDFKDKRDQRKKAIQAILAACDKLGIKSREVKCSILACAGGESGFIPQNELYNYSSPEHLANTFVTTFKKKHPEKAEQYSNAKKKGMSAYDFFSFVYLTENNGAGLGNRNADDAGKYIGRGLTGITGYNNYKYYGNSIGVDLLSNPEILNTDLSVSALASTYMIWDNTKKKFPKVSETANPDYFYAAKRAQGKDTGNGAETRLKYYEYFYGNKVSSTFTEDKSAAPPPPSEGSSASGGGGTTGSGPSSTGAGPNGFKDPNNKYPLSNHTKEADTNRLARGQGKGTVVSNKELSRKTGIPKANGLGTIDEPKSSFAGKYPYNHVTETESGHIQEFDDTPGHERIHQYHRKGTFYEIDPNGSKITHIVGDNYEIIDRNGVIYIAGECSITIGGEANILCQNNAEIEVAGNLNMNVGGDYTLGVAGNMTVAVGGNTQMQSGANTTVQANSNMHLLAGSNSYLYTFGAANIKASGHLSMDANRVDVNNGAAVAATSISLTPPPVGTVSTNNFEYLEAPPPEGEEAMLIETEEEWASPAGKAAQAANEKQYGSETPAAQDETKAAGGTDKNTVASCQVIYGMQEFTNDFKLSEHFTLGMLIDGGINGHNKLRDQQGLTKQQIVCNLSQLCQNIYEPLLAVLPGGIGGYGKQWKINSGYRISSNIPDGGSKTSDHMLGRATDLTLLPYGSNKAQRNYEFAIQIEKILPYDQIIMEYMPNGGNWVHIGYRGVKEGDTAGGGTNRKMAFTMYNGKTIKKDGFVLQ